MIQRNDSSPTDPHTPPPYPPDAGTDRIRHDIENTRAEMDETLDALSNRLRPKALLSELWGAVQQHSGVDKQQIASEAADFAKRAGQSAWEGVKRHPIPSLLIGAGVAWLLTDRHKDDDDLPYRYSGPHTPHGALEDDDYAAPSHRDPDVDQRSTGEKFKDAGRSVAHKAADVAEHAKTQVQSAASSAAHAVSSAASRTGHRVASAGAQAGHAIQDTAAYAGHAIQDGVSHAGHAVKQRATRWGEQASDAAVRAGGAVRHAAERSAEVGKQKFDQSLENYPLALGAAALGTGLVVGLLLPRTKKEDQWMGKQADEVKDAALRTGEDLMHRGREVAATTLHAVADEARAQGLGPHELAEKARHVIDESALHARQTIHDEGLSPRQLEQKVEKVAHAATDTVREELDHHSDEAGEKARKEAEKAKQQM